MPDPNDLDLVNIATQLVAAYVTTNSVPAAALPSLIVDVHASLAGLSRRSSESAPASGPQVQRPAVPIKKSITPDYLVCLESGRQFKSLRRHLQSAYGMTPEQYRTKWGLPSSYPMVASGYSAARSALAKNMGLGRMRRSAPGLARVGSDTDTPEAPATDVVGKPEVPRTRMSEPKLKQGGRARENT